MRTISCSPGSVVPVPCSAFHEGEPLLQRRSWARVAAPVRRDAHVELDDAGGGELRQMDLMSMSPTSDRPLSVLRRAAAEDGPEVLDALGHAGAPKEAELRLE